MPHPHTHLHPGDFSSSLRDQTFGDGTNTNYLDAAKFVANLVWNGEDISNSPHANLYHGRVPDEAGPQPP